MSASPDDPNTRERGALAERLAEAALRDAGLRVVDKNVHAGGGELDLIAVEEGGADQTWVFVEVRSRADLRRGHPLETIGSAKQRHLRRAASAYLLGRGLFEKVAVRFDVIAIVGGEVDAWVRGAFE